MSYLNEHLYLSTMKKHVHPTKIYANGVPIFLRNYYTLWKEVESNSRKKLM